MIEQKKDGFTLIELLGILVLLAIIGLISFKVIDSSLKKGKNDAYEKQLKMIELSAKNYMSEHSDKLPNVGSKTYVTLGFLKVFGFSEMKVVNPKNKKCFSNDLTIVVTKPTSNADYVYEIDRNTIKEVDDCGITDVSTEEPSVSISGGAEYVAHDGGQVSYTVAYNKSVSDAQANEYIKYYASETTTGSELSINVEQTTANGYYREVVLTLDNGHPGGEKFYVEALEGLVTIGNRKSPYVKSNDLYVSEISSGPYYIMLCDSTDFINSKIFSDNGISCHFNPDYGTESGDSEYTSVYNSPSIMNYNFHVLSYDGDNVYLMADEPVILMVYYNLDCVEGGARANDGYCDDAPADNLYALLEDKFSSDWESSKKYIEKFDYEFCRYIDGYYNSYSCLSSKTTNLTNLYARVPSLLDFAVTKGVDPKTTFPKWAYGGDYWLTGSTSSLGGEYPSTSGNNEYYGNYYYYYGSSSGLSSEYGSPGYSAIRNLQLNIRPVIAIKRYHIQAR